MEDTGLTFKEWSDAGFMIRRGEKSDDRDVLGEPLFFYNQVKDLKNRRKPMFNTRAPRNKKKQKKDPSVPWWAEKSTAKKKK